MISNYFKIAWRNLLKSKFYSLINGTGLTLGLSVGILILLWVQDELSFDRFHKQADHIYKLENLVGTGSSKQIWTTTVAPIATQGKNELPEIKGAVRLSYNDSYTLFRYKDKVFNETNSLFADPSLFSVFDFKLVKGDEGRPFTDDNTIVLTETTAKKYFGNEDPIGKILNANDRVSFTVSGVVKDFPKNSTIQGDLFLPIGKLFRNRYGSGQGRNENNDFHEFNYSTYFLLQPGTIVAGLADKLRDIHLRNKPDDTDLTYLLHPLTKKHLYQADGSNGGIETVRMFVVIALLILGIACINYINLSTARSMLRSKEVSMRKIVGAARKQLFLQFIIETALVFVIASTVAVVLIYSLLPLYNQLSGKQLVFDFTNIQIWKVIGLTLMGTLTVSSIYPAILLSSFEPLRAFKGKASAKISDVAMRKVLVVTQFAVSVILIIGTFVISTQLDYIHSKALGYDKNHVLSFNMRSMGEHFEAVKADLLNQPGITAVTRAGSNIVRIGSQTGSSDWDGKEKGETMMIRPMAIEKDFLSFFKMQLVEGQGFTGSVSDSTHFILNETAVRASRMKDPIGKRFKIWDLEGTIIGVVKDFHTTSMRKSIDPAVFYYNADHANQIYIKTTGNDAEKAIAAAERSWKKYNGDFEFSYTFLDQAFNDLYRSEQQSGTLFNLFAGIAIIISCLGLFGLAAYTAQVRTREIGVRKVLGSSVPAIVSLLAKDFIRLILIAIVIAIPIAWYGMNSWLQDFAYKISISWWMFAAAGGMALAVALITISYQSIRAALMDPVKSLRSE
ncbi:ABC transporter permease [Dyadobacter aurulentus]|uniref:ABC transporter permease n=1 Tax=Dyadobacter sp. UC 10 TaxID=2605428 RepID=UPI0011F3A5D8|nr:ABC transporter permease [Dyadobacter sp. UC 10]KAA0989135.1 FtsX-like permease family protein [Dyadobacter sp. UC 10]